MERDRNSKILAIIALTVAVIGLSLGFAAFSQTLTIHSSAEVKPDQTAFNVKFSSSEESLATEEITGVPGGEAGATADPATISGTEISGLKAKFTKPGQDVTYTFYVRNEGEYDAYLKSITYQNASGVGTSINCKPGSDTDAGLVATACEGMKVTVTVNSTETTTQSNSSISEHKLAKGEGEEVKVKIEYTAGSGVADGDFTVEIGDIELLYKSQDK